MVSIREFESQFDLKLKEIDEVPWLEIKLRLLFDLYAFIDDVISENQRSSYNIQLSNILTAIIDQFEIETFSFINPKYLQTALSKIEQNQESVYSIKLVYAGCLSFLRLNEFRQLLKVAKQFQLYKQTENNETESYDSIPDFLQKTESHFDANLYSALKNEYHILNTVRSSNNSINALFAVSHDTYKAGVIAKLSLMDISISKRYGTDLVRIASHIVDEKDILADQVKQVCRIMKQNFGFQKDQYQKLEYSIDQPVSLLRGNSLGAGMALLAQAGLDGYEKNRTMEYRIYDDVAVTGALDKNGQILPVSGHSIKHKVAAAFFSRINSIVVPKDQVNDVAESLGKLQEMYPKRRFQIIPAGTFSGLIKKRDIIYLQRRKIKKRVGQFLRDYANSVTYSIMAFILLLGAGFWFGIVKHPVPAEAMSVYEKSRVYIKNKFGFTIWKSGFGGVHGRVFDLDNDGDPEVLINYSSEAEGDNRSKLVCYTFNAAKLWHFNIGDEVIYGDNIYSDYFGAGTIYINDLNEDGNPEIFSIGSQGYFPTRLFILNWQGKLISDYWHTGSPSEPIVAEIFPDNGTKEIMFCGRNNEYKSGILVVIDPFKINGQSPYKSHYYTKQGTNLGNEIYYIRFPDTHFRFVSYRDITKKLVLNSSGDIKVWMISSFKPDAGHIEYVFDQSLNVKFVDIADNYYRLYAKTFPDRDMLEYNNQKLINYFRSVDYWDGDKWTKERTVNKRYLNTLKTENIADSLEIKLAH